MSDSATRPIEQPWEALAALLILAHTSALRLRALPTLPMTAHSGASSYRF